MVISKTDIRYVEAKAHPNIAFIKYWGKRDLRLNLPVTDSVSVALDAFSVNVRLSELDGPEDTMVWNGVPVSVSYQGRFARLLEWARERSGVQGNVALTIRSNLPSRVGLASSAATLAAFAKALNDYFELALDPQAISCLARRGSGSAARSVPGGFAWWHRGGRPDGLDSFAEEIIGPSQWPDLVALVVVLTTKAKDVSSSEGMIRCAETSVLYPSWVAECRDSAAVAVAAIKNRDFEALARVSERNALMMHSACIASTPPIIYMKDSTINLISIVQEIKRDLPVFFTLDAGPNPVLFTLAAFKDQLIRSIGERLPHVAVFPCCPGPGVQSVSPGDK